MATQQTGVDVVAAAAGQVLRVRDGMQDVSVRVLGADAIKGRECGNGVVIDHGAGWQTEYCHMAKGSIEVRPGQSVVAGKKLGRVGLSGDTEFPHLHLNVSHEGKIVDPFAPDAPQAGTCGGGKSLWIHPPVYTTRSVINYGFSGAPLDMDAIERGAVVKPDPQAGYLIAYVRTIGLRSGDEPSLQLSSPDGSTLAQSEPTPIPTNQAQRFLLVGRRRHQQSWEKGLYSARYIVRADNKVVLEQKFTLQLQ